jgi:HEAT repeat protein
MLKRNGTVDAAKCRTVISAGLAMPGCEERLVAVRLAMHPSVKMRADLVPLLNAPEAEIRRAALFAVGSATDDEVVIGDEDLFHWLHDADTGVRAVCRDTLASRGRTETEISLARRLSHPDAAERLKLLLDLRYDDEVSDPEPWLERLSRDAEPGVRAGAARVAVEVAADRQLPTPVWVGRLADSDSSSTVRRVASYYRAQTTSKPSPIQQIDGRNIP